MSINQHSSINKLSEHLALNLGNISKAGNALADWTSLAPLE